MTAQNKTKTKPKTILKTKSMSKPQTEKPVMKKSMSKRQGLTLLILVLLFALILLLIRQYALVVTVNGKPIWRHQVINRLEQQGGQAVVDGLIERSLIDQEAAKNNIVITQEEVDAKVKEITANFGGDENVLLQQLEQEGFTLEDLRENFRLQLALEKLVPMTEVTDEEAKTFFDENIDLYGEGADFESLKESVKAQLQQDSFSRSLQEYIAKLRENSNVKNYLEY